jgi:putative membrane protein
MHFLIRLLISAAALWVAVAIVPGVEHTGPGYTLLAVALVFGVVNAVIRPILMILTFPLVLLTLGLFILILNAILLWLTAGLSNWLGLGFHVAGFGSALLGALVVAIVSTLLNIFVGERR